MSKKTTFTTPVGRLVAGSLYEPQTKDVDGNPLLIKSGPNQGQPTQRFFFALAIPKGNETHWAYTEWGAAIWAVGHQAFPQAAQSRAFAWKVKDGDSTEPDQKGKRPCDREGYPGHWVVSFSSSFAPTIYNANGTQQITEPNAVKLGYFVQVNASVDGNNSNSKPGVYLNHNMVALAAYGPEIVVGPDATAVGFGQGVTLPPGASATPPAGFAPPAAPGAPAPAAPAPAAPAVAAAAPAPTLPATPAPAPAPAAAAPTPAAAPAPASAGPTTSLSNVAPHPGFIAPPPAAPAAPVVQPRMMLPAANGIPYEAYVANGWTDEVLRANGYMA